MRRSWWVEVVCALALAGCGSGDDNGSSSAAVSWAGSDNGIWVVDALGAEYEFDALYGCMQYLGGVFVSDDPKVGPCLEHASPAGFANWGNTNCGYQSHLFGCDSALFGIYLTNDPNSPTQCMAVIGTSEGVRSVTGKALIVSPAYEAIRLFFVELAPQSFFSLYWDGTIPICGGHSPFTGTYIGTGTYCGVEEALQFQIDSGGVIHNDTTQISGVVSSDGTGEFRQSSPAVSQCPTNEFTISSGTQDEQGAWVLSGANFSVTQH